MANLAGYLSKFGDTCYCYRCANIEEMESNLSGWSRITESSFYHLPEYECDSCERLLSVIVEEYGWLDKKI